MNAESEPMGRRGRAPCACPWRPPSPTSSQELRGNKISFCAVRGASVGSRRSRSIVGYGLGIGIPHRLHFYKPSEERDRILASLTLTEAKNFLRS